MKSIFPELVLRFNPFPVLTTERRLLRPFLIEDAESLYFMRSNDRVMKYLGRDKMKSVEEASEYIQKVLADSRDRKSIEWSMTLKDSN